MAIEALVAKRKKLKANCQLAIGDHSLSLSLSLYIYIYTHTVAHSNGHNFLDSETSFQHVVPT